MVVISNPFWQGFYTFFNDATKSWSNIYIGDGMKTKQYYIPTSLADILKEPSDVREHAEPNHFEKPKAEDDEVNPDADADADDDD